MDEWTNQLDAENEILVMEELLKNKADKIIIFITHRMTSIRKADKIFCLENWNITDQWTHQELLKWDNIYKSFWEKQVIH
jgi:ATP-binding cassette subfamily B protein